MRNSLLGDLINSFSRSSSLHRSASTHLKSSVNSPASNSRCAGNDRRYFAIASSLVLQRPSCPRRESMNIHPRRKHFSRPLSGFPSELFKQTRRTESNKTELDSVVHRFFEIEKKNNAWTMGLSEDARSTVRRVLKSRLVGRANSVTRSFVEMYLRDRSRVCYSVKPRLPTLIETTPRARRNTEG